VSDLRERGVIGILALVDPSKETQARLKGILEHIGGQQFGTYALMASPMPKEGL
jgi:hypothetical protein